ncbi:Rhv domain containing protein [Pyrenophora tritici-repentis]|uniref:Rhv domain containing protein n=1 Tax=Pyrenophora tritici-repentis TaxID=45151 RepID=A0A922N480_9PLEO|nr:Rhv domain containing protein [Pyrenophora tritici-repentis]KAI1679921.1 Rhv domain containing protein [Pyrenophora tritici-repentis]
MASNWMKRFHNRFGNAQSISATIRRRAAGEGSSVFSRRRDPPSWAGSCVVAVIPTGVQGHSANIWQRQGGDVGRASGFPDARYQGKLQHFRPGALERPVSVAPGTWEGERAERDGVQEGGTRHNQRQEEAFSKSNYYRGQRRGRITRGKWPSRCATTAGVERIDSGAD